MEDYSRDNEEINEACHLVSAALCTVDVMKDLARRDSNFDGIISLPVVREGFGRPRFEISSDRLLAGISSDRCTGCSYVW